MSLTNREKELDGIFTQVLTLFRENKITHSEILQSDILESIVYEANNPEQYENE